MIFITKTSSKIDQTMSSIIGSIRTSLPLACFGFHFDGTVNSFLLTRKNAGDVFVHYRAS
jgi:hypothetical protein